ncbi:ferric reductase-like transmembrane domain-containing protein [Entomohabitans teleogrylli]|uniref:ferredoxin reductase family protein n=1 Tax=Entomohabitans teleogrylli TaxID=1384589 RepID=UPI00073D4DE3|nr:ferric reductase-like transmembrane domain-containing protein [Entomohabitans teleogrylli]
MKKIIYLGVITFLAACVIYFIPQWEILLTPRESWWPLRKEIVLFSGTVAWLFMTLGMVLSLRLAVLEPLTGGLDKGYLLHKWAGIIALSTGVLHWLMEMVPGWLVRQGWIAPSGNRGPGARSASDWSRELASLGEHVAEWAIYILIILCLISLIKKIPYRLFRYLHKLFPLVYLAITFHAITILAKTRWWQTPSAWVMVVLAIIGSVAAIISLLQLTGRKRQISAVVSEVKRGDDTLDITLQLAAPFAYRSGQFAFLRFEHYPEAHPYTIASSPDHPDTLRFVIKALGDDTRRLLETLAPGEKALVEGPYGCFDFNRPVDRQIWVAGGIGMTPFLSRLTALAHSGGATVPTDFWYCGRQDAPEGLQALCLQAGVRLHLVNSQRQGRLHSATLRQAIPSGAHAGVWFCGPAAFGRALRRGLASDGGGAVEFHSDNFSMR